LAPETAQENGPSGQAGGTFVTTTTTTLFLGGFVGVIEVDPVTREQPVPAERGKT
jgi:hypothetical protein